VCGVENGDAASRRRDDRFPRDRFVSGQSQTPEPDAKLSRIKPGHPGIESAPDAAVIRHG
jgi:hypothetical protein